jgi:hypothetical protein
MRWIIFSSTLQSTSGSSSRVTLWRRLKRLGAISPVSGLYILPDRETCLEGFQWLAQEIRQEGGQALVLHVEAIEGLLDEQVIALFCEARKKDYDEIRAEISMLEAENAPVWKTVLTRLRKQFNEVRNIDYFNCADGVLLEQQLDRLALSIAQPQTSPVPALDKAVYTDRVWVTRPRPHVDRLACIWFIRRFIDAGAVIRYAPGVHKGEIGFDMMDGEFTHSGNLCTFEVMIRAFGHGQDAPLSYLAQLIHDIDLQDAAYRHPETAGIEAVLRGWLVMGLSDQELEAHGVVLFEGLYQGFAQRGEA